MTDTFMQDIAPTFWDRLLFAQPFKYVINSDATPEACANQLLNLAQPQSGAWRRAHRHVEILPGFQDSYQFEIHQRAATRSTSYTTVKVEGVAFRDDEIARTVLQGKIAFVYTNLLLIIAPVMFLLLAIFVPSLRVIALFSLVAAAFQGVQIAADYRRLRAAFFQTLDRL